MKSIEEAAKECAYDNCEMEGKRNAYVSFGFIAGAEFAQRWIPVEEELPRRNKNVLLKRSKPFNLYEITGFKVNGKFYSNETAKEIIKVTHWRPINLK